jgi:hypothetical protein
MVILIIEIQLFKNHQIKKQFPFLSNTAEGSVFGIGTSGGIK